MDFAAVGIWPGHGVPMLCEMMANTMKPLMEPYFAPRFPAPCPRRRISDNCVCGAVAPITCGHP